MRRLAERLEVSPNALYSHVQSKTALVDEVLDDVLAGVQSVEGAATPPEAALRALMLSTYELLLEHPDLVSLYLTRRGARGPNAQHLGEIMLALLARAGVTDHRAREALRVLIVYTIGFAAFTTQRDATPDGAPAANELHGNFETGLRWLLAAITTPR